MSVIRRLSIVLPHAGALALILLLGALAIVAAGASPLLVTRAFVVGVAGDLNSVGETLVKATPLLLAGLGVAIAFRARVWNIGAEGQIYMGGLAAAVISLALRDLPGPVLVALVLGASFLAGGLWGALAAGIKVRFGVNEIISTLMLNYVAFYLVSYLLHGPLKGARSFYPESAEIPEAARWPAILPGSRLHAGILLGLILALGIHLLISRTTVGFRIRAVGDNSEAARLAGIPVSRYVVVCLLLSGGMAGLAGLAEVAGIHHRLIEKMSPGYGYTAIMVALLGRLHPGGIVAAAVFTAGVLVGLDNAQRVARVPSTLADVVMGVTVLAVLAVSSGAPMGRLLRARGPRVD